MHRDVDEVVNKIYRSKPEWGRKHPSVSPTTEALKKKLQDVPCRGIKEEMAHIFIMVSK